MYSGRLVGVSVAMFYQSARKLMFKANKTFANLRKQMIDEIRGKYGLKSPKVLSAMLQISRHKFVGKSYRSEAYLDKPLVIGFGQTISQPYTVAFMTHLLIKKLNNFNKVLEIGTGSGYQAAILSELFNEVYTIEIVPELVEQAKKTLRRLGYRNVFVKEGSGEWGWEEKSPYDAIIVTAGMEKVPQKLFDQLSVGGVLIAPVGKGADKEMIRFTKVEKQGNEELKKEEFGIFHFVPFIKHKN